MCHWLVKSSGAASNKRHVHDKVAKIGKLMQKQERAKKMVKSV
jgi:hypothetical protein